MFVFYIRRKISNIVDDLYYIILRVKVTTELFIRPANHSNSIHAN